jgi:hypothetical protein
VAVVGSAWSVCGFSRVVDQGPPIVRALSLEGSGAESAV